MSDEIKGLYKFGGWAFMASGVLFLVMGVLDLMTGPPPSSGPEILAWAASSDRNLEIAAEVLFFAAMFLVPAVIALYRSTVGIGGVWAASACGAIAVAIPIIAMLDIVLGRFVYPVYGVRIRTPEIAEFAVGLYYGGLHAVGIIMGVATLVLSLAIRHSASWKPVAYLGVLTGVLDIVGGYPYVIGPILTLVCQAFFAAWFVTVGVKLSRVPVVRGA